MSVDIPVVDLQAALADDAPEELLAAVRAAAEQIGIIQVVNHGVPQEVIDEFHTTVGRVLALPRAEKEQLASPTGHPSRGWRQWPDDFGRLELERINIGQYDNPEDALAAGLTAEQAQLFAHVNVWPEQEPALRAAAFRYRDAVAAVGRRVLALYARVLGVPDDTFPVDEDGYSTFVVNDYPTWTHTDTAADDEKLLLLEHADGSVVTVLHQEGDYAGLQGQRPDGSWQSVPILPGALQVFTGSLLTNWTEGRLRPGRHRVVSGGTVTRRSSAVFLYPTLDSVVEPLPPFADPDDSDFEPVSIWEQASGSVEEYLQVFGRPEQVAAWREGRPYIAELAQ
ncbi:MULTISPECIES: 2-oxoglutarate and iron-dependent oxygenase domain-containing protein [unclassified Streptomyces]|uniref:2-oxoglutarate and iron-dependent oxygenase domain-containing protein n=1 Tax=unclassified Streptomyces TaxID=2593676 RepID=UPI002E294D89|nr:2-oxoglutarate and iron-dependent oxygenase domain-containing protein [Streptomyces sp. NBC_00223]